MRYKLKKHLLIIAPSIFIKRGTIVWFIGAMAANPKGLAVTFLCVPIKDSIKAYQVDVTDMYSKEWMEEYFDKVLPDKTPLKVPKHKRHGSFIDGEDYVMVETDTRKKIVKL